jgi:hypothetical protein
MDYENSNNVGIAYLKGILHTFAALNTPESNLRYEYDIIAFEKAGSDLKEAIITQFHKFTSQKFSVDLITGDEFKNLLAHWLFEKKFVSEQKVERQINSIYKLLENETNLSAIYAINGLDADNWSYDFGVGYDYFVITGGKMLYMIYFMYED